MARWKKSPEPKPEAQPDPASKWPAEVEAAWAKAMAEVTQDLQAPSKGERAEKLALLTAPFVGLPRERTQLKRTDDPDFNKLDPRVRLAVLTLDKLENQGMQFAGIRKPKLAKIVSDEAGESVSTRTLGKAEKYRREHPLRTS